MLRLPGQQPAGLPVTDRPAARRPVAEFRRVRVGRRVERPTPAAVAARRTAGAHAIAQPAALTGRGPGGPASCRHAP